MIRGMVLTFDSVEFSSRNIVSLKFFEIRLHYCILARELLESIVRKITL